MVRRRALVVAIASTLLLLTGCSPATNEKSLVQDDGEVAVQSSLYQTPDNFEEIIHEVTQATFLIECPHASGSGWGYAHNSLGEYKKAIITNHHVIESCLEEDVKPVITDHNWDEFEAEILAYESVESDADKMIETQDLAILMPETSDFSALSGYSTNYSPGIWVMTSAYPALDPEFFSHAITIGNIATDTMLDGVVITAGVNPGASGGIVVNSLGQVLGTIYSGYDEKDINDAGFFLPMRRLWDLTRDLELGK